MWDHDVRYAQLCDAARHHAGRDDVNPERILEQFETLVTDLVAHARRDADEVRP